MDDIYVVHYCVQLQKAIRKYDELLEEVYANTEGRNVTWLYNIICILAVISILFVLLKLFIGNDIARLTYSLLCMLLWVAFGWNILHMKCADEIETANKDEAEEEKKECSINAATMADYADFLAELHDALLLDRLYANEELTREIVAKAMGTNHKYLTQRLKAATGMTFSAYVNEVRLKESIGMLCNTGMTVEEVFYACGYQTKSTYYRAFNKKYGCTPLEYRRKMRSQPDAAVTTK